MLIAILAAAVMAMMPAQSTENDVQKAEQAFDAYTHDHGYTKGFYTWSAPDAVSFTPQAVKIHEKLGVTLAADASEKDAPSKLRWRPYRISVAASDDLAWDMGPWTIEGSDKAGWFFTVWQKQADGNWRWVLDTGAGPATPATIPPEGARETSNFSFAITPSPTVLQDAESRDTTLNIDLAANPATVAYGKLANPIFLIVAGDSASPATSRKAIAAALEARPAGLTWTLDGKGASQAGDLIYTYGHAAATDRTFKGSYVRIWRRMASLWLLTVDIWQGA